MAGASGFSRLGAGFSAVVILCTSATLPCHGQAAPPPSAPAQFDPSDVYFQGWLLSKDAEKLAEEERYLEALEKLRRAKQLFDTVARTFPDWKADMVRGRLAKTSAGIAEVTPGALKEQDEKEQAIAELEGGARRGGVLSGDSPRRLDTGVARPEVLPTRPVETLESSRIKELESQVARLKSEMPVQGRDQDRERDLSIAELRKIQAELDRLRRKSAEEPMQDELRALSRRIQGLEGEKSVMGRALESSQTETSQAKAEIDALQRERVRLMQQVADLQRNLEVERKAANEVVEGQRKQLEHFKQQLKQRDADLATANRRIQSLETELAEVRDSFNDLREERDELLRERDNMASLLQLNEAGQLQQVIDQNLALDRELRETKQRYDALQANSDATKDDLLEALRDLAISKRRIQLFRQEKTEQEARLADLQARLRNEQRQLGTSEADPIEVEMLRGIIQRQLKIQEKRHEARDLLLATLDDKARGDENIRRAMNIFQGAELNLSPEELKVIEGQQVDGVLISPYASTRADVDRNLSRLESELAPYSKAGTRAFLNGRLRAAREAFEMIVERNPGDSASMCKLALVEYKLDDLLASSEMFRRACEVDPRNPYAHRMLGHTLARLGDDDEALRILQRSTELAPTNAEGFLLLGNLQARIGNLQAAEESFQTASACEETLFEPHYNLAILLARSDRPKKGLEHYAKALELGAAPNLDLEQRLQQQP